MKAFEPSDLVGLVGMGLVCFGVWKLAGPSWSALLLGTVLVTLWVLREMRDGRRR
jgi:hypothetical protein